jgi:hypothetical protein
MARLPRTVVLNKRTIDAIAEAAGDAPVVAGSARCHHFEQQPTRAAPDGRTFREIIASEGIDGMSAREAQFDTPWLRRQP